MMDETLDMWIEEFMLTCLNSGAHKEVWQDKPDQVQGPMPQIHLYPCA